MLWRQPPSFPLSSAPQSIHCSQDASNSWHRFRDMLWNTWLSLLCRVDATIFLLRQAPKQFCEIGCPLHLLLNRGSSTVFKGIFRATYARYIDATPLSYDLTEPPSLLQIDSKNPLGVQRMGLPRCSKALSEPFVLDRCRTSLFDATSKSHANRFQRSVGYSNSASSMLFKRIFGTACARFIDATPLSCDLAEPPSLLQTAIAYLNRASSMSFIFFLSNPFPSIFRQIPRIYLRNRLPSLLFQVDATILMLK